jgi:hypothetical protein
LFGAPARIFRFRERTQQPVTQGLVFGQQRCRIHRLFGDCFVYLPVWHNQPRWSLRFSPPPALRMAFSHDIPIG